MKKARDAIILLLIFIGGLAGILVALSYVGDKPETDVAMRVAFMYAGLVFVVGLLGFIHPRLITPKGSRTDAFGLYFFLAMGAVLVVGGTNWIATTVAEAHPQVAKEKASADQPETNTKSDNPMLQHVQKPVVGCRSRKLFDRLSDIVNEGDKETAQRLMYAGIAAGDCKILQPGTAVYVEDVELFGPMKVRPKGELAAYWTNGEVVD